MSTRELKHDLESRMIRIAISVPTFLALLVAPAGAIQAQDDALHDGAPVTAAFDQQLDALNKKLAEIMVRPLPTTADLLSSTLYSTVERRTKFPIRFNLPPEWLMRSHRWNVMSSPKVTTGSAPADAAGVVELPFTPSSTCSTSSRLRRL